MPDDYRETIGKLQKYLSRNQILAILSCSKSFIANKIILDYLIERIRCREGLLDLCDQLDSIITSPHLKLITNIIRFSKLLYYFIELMCSSAQMQCYACVSLTHNCV